MLFNSYAFLIFLPVVFLLYWFVYNDKLKQQNILLLAASYFFYGFWDWRFLGLLAISTLICYYTGQRIASAESAKGRKRWLWLGVVVSLGFLCYFKYFNFFIQSFADLLNLFGMEAHPLTLHIILPIGISFYTFHGLSYLFDIYNNKIQPTKSLVNYSLFVSFFPLLVAGPIERATHLLPQTEKARTFDGSKAVDGLRQILWGFFKKIVIADNCGSLADNIFNNYGELHGSTLVLGIILFSFQTYGDFSGYSDIAIGTARLFGFEVFKNFNFPYFSRNVAEFWRRWHISLTSWFRDYLYIPMGGSREGQAKTIRNVFIIFILSGFWHGADWTFIVWGLLNALFILPSIVFKTNRKYLNSVAHGKFLPSVKEFFQMGGTFLLIAFSRIFFRSESMTQAFGYIRNMFTADLFSLPKVYSGQVFLLMLLLVVIEWLGREDNYALEGIGQKVNSRALRWLFYYFIIALIIIYWGEQRLFIYFQF